MASIAAVKSDSEGGNGFSWTFTHADDPVRQLVPGGRYTVSVEGTFGGASIEIFYGNASGNTASVDADLLTFTENGSYNIEIGRGYVRPVRTGGAAASIVATLTPIPTR